MNRIPLDTPAHCRAELERCSTGLAVLDHQFTVAREELDKAEDEWGDMEAAAWQGIRRPDDPKSVTATELSARFRAKVAADQDLGGARLRMQTAQRNLDLIDRWYRSLEKRASNAQSALKQHDSEHRYAGFTGHTNYGG